jgi:hypothetical protein
VTSVARRRHRSIATENTEIGKKDERTQQIVGAAIEVHLNFGCPRIVEGIHRISL